MKIFISHNTKDQEIASALGLKLEEQGHSVWIDKRILRSGDGPLGDEMQAVEEADTFLLVVSSDALDCEWVRQETQHALKTQKERDGLFQIVPVLVGDAELGALKWVFPGDPPKIRIGEAPDELDEVLPELLTILQKDSRK